jgi:thiol-disulfide isomerase/thioredoxin
MIQILPVTLLLLTLSSMGYGQTPEPAPSLVIKDISGRPLKLSDYRGKVVLINFWATWCAPCRKETPDLTKWQRDYKSKGLQIIGITYPPQEVAEVKEFIREFKLNYPVALGTEETREKFDSESDVLPITVVIDRQGKLVTIIRGIMLPDDFEKTVKPLLVSAPGGAKQDR